MKTLTFLMIVIKPSQSRLNRNKQIHGKNAIVAKQCLWQGSLTRGPWAAVSKRGYFMRPAMRLQNFQIFKI